MNIIFIIIFFISYLIGCSLQFIGILSITVFIFFSFFFIFCLSYLIGGSLQFIGILSNTAFIFLASFLICLAYIIILLTQKKIRINYFVIFSLVFLIYIVLNGLYNNTHPIKILIYTMYAI